MTFVEDEMTERRNDNAARERALAEENQHRFICPINYTIMEDPVNTADGHTYERTAIEAWFDTQRRRGLNITSPKTGLALANTTLIANNTLAEEIRAFVAVNNNIDPNEVKFTLSSEIFGDLDRIPTLMAGLQLLTPQIVVLGNESHGKSSLLERIVGLPIFPRDKGVCTRCVVRVQLRRCGKESHPAEICVVNRADKSEVPGSARIVALDNIRAVIKSIMDELRAACASKEIIDDKEINVKLRLPYCLNLDLLDLPGLVTINPTGAIQNVPKATKDLALSVIKESEAISMFLLVNDIRVQLNQSRGCEVVQAANLQDRTFGIFTKIDTFSSEDGDEIDELCDTIECRLPSSFQLANGWLATSSKRSQRELQQQSRVMELGESGRELRNLTAIDVAELGLINTRFALVQQRTNKLGIKVIRQKLQTAYETFIIERWVPAILDSLKPPQRELETSLISMGLPLAKCPQYQPYLTDLTFRIVPLTIGLVDEYLDASIRHALSKQVNWLSLRNEAELWGYMVLYSSCLSRKKADAVSHPFNFANTNSYGKNNARNTMITQYFKNESEAKPWIVKQQDAFDAQQALVEELTETLRQILSLLQRKSNTMIDTFMNLINQERDGAVITKFDRFTAIQEHLRAIAEGQFNEVNKLLEEFYHAYVNKFFALDPLTSSYNDLFAMEYFYDDNEVWCCLHVKTLTHVQELPHLLLHKWNELANRHVKDIQSLINITKTMLEVEDCKDARVKDMKSFVEYKRVEEAVREFARKAGDENRA